MDTLENSNGLTQEKMLSKDSSENHTDDDVHNGYVDNHKTSNGKVNGDHAEDIIDKTESVKPTVDENKGFTNDPIDHDEGNIKENEIDGPKDNLRVEEDMDNSTATSNISDLSAYEDSEKSMDIGDGKVEQEGDKIKENTNAEGSVAEKEISNETVKNASESGEVTKDIDASSETNDEHEKENIETEKENMDVVDSVQTNAASEELDENTAEEGKENIGIGDSMHADSPKTDGKVDKDEKPTKSEVNASVKLDAKISEKESLMEDKTTNGISDKNTLETIAQDGNSNSSINLECKEKMINEQELSKKDDKKLLDKDTKLDKNLSVEETTNKQSSLKSVDKVTDIDGSEILITINEEIEESDNEDNNSKKEKVEKKSEISESDLAKINDEIEKKVAEICSVKVTETVPKVSTTSVTSTVNIQVPQNTVLKSTLTSSIPPVRFPVMSGPLLQYTLPTSIHPNTQQKYINVGGQQLLITLPGLSHVGTPGHTSISLSSSGNSYIGAGPLMNVNMVAATFPPPTLNRKPLDKNLDIDIPQTSWEQLELIKHEIVTRKPDNAFWGGLANVNKKADLGSVSKFLFDLGSDIVKESAYEQIVQVQKKKEDASQLSDNEKESLHRMKRVVQELKDKLKYLHDLPQLKCKCGFKTESRNVMLLHKQYPHTFKGPDKFPILSCARCNERFEGKFAEDFFKTHLAKEHSVVPRILSRSTYFSCNLCNFEGTTKNSLVKHQLKCVKNFKPHLNLAPHHVDINLILKNIFYNFQVVNKKAQQAHAASVEQPDTRGSSIVKSVAPNRPPSTIQPKPITRPAIQVNPNRPIIPPQFQQQQGNVIPSANQWQGNFGRMLQPTSVINRPPPPLKPSVNKPTVNQLLKTHPTNASTNRTGFEVCEICGGYVKDRMSLRIHFFYAHKIEMPAHVFSKPLAPLFCSTCSERFWTSQGFAKHKSSVKHLQNLKKAESPINQCWICHQRPDNLYSHLLKFHRLTTGECMALKRCMFCGILSPNRKELELHMAAAHGVLIKGDEHPTNKTVSQLVAPTKPAASSNVSTKNLSTVVTGGSTGMVRNNFCVFCSAQFGDNTKLTLHCLSVHATCKKCGMVVNKASDLARHVCKMSSKTCSICGMKNLKPAGLIKHLETHTKPCRVALKRLSPYQIEYAKKGKYPREYRNRSGNSNSRSRNSHSDDVKVDKDQRRNPLTVALKFDNVGKSKGVITLDKKDADSKKEEVVIESDNDSDVILQEEERTEIILDSDIEEDVNKKGVEANDKSETTKDSENLQETESRKETETYKNDKEIKSSESKNETVTSESKKETETSDSKKETETPKNEKESKSSETSEKMESDHAEAKNEVKHDSSSDKLMENENSDSEKDKESIEEEKGEEKSNDDSKDRTEITDDSANVAIEENSCDSNSTKNSRKRSHSDIENESDVEEDIKKQKTDDESEKL